MEENTLVIIKPDGVKRNLIGQIIKFYEGQNLTVSNIKMLVISFELAELHYSEHIGKEFYDRLLNYITAGPSVALVIKGKDCINRVRNINNDLRNKFGINNTQNTVHGSDSKESAEREITLFFGNELY